ncbi:hypothetical protein B0H13DRAFT_1900599 [Mycena leptocephala]|nr:hypothetical protein B0H13DRAFT_1900599 [Mycena leptocephala]
MRWNHESPDYKGGYWTDGVTYTEEELTAADGLGGLGEDNRYTNGFNLALYECGYGHAVGTQISMDSPSEDYNTRLAWNPSPKGAMQGYDYYQRVSASDRASHYDHLGTTSISHASNPIQTTANTVNFRKAKSVQACNFCRLVAHKSVNTLHKSDGGAQGKPPRSQGKAPASAVHLPRFQLLQAQVTAVEYSHAPDKRRGS